MNFARYYTDYSNIHFSSYAQNFHVHDIHLLCNLYHKAKYAA